jgi:CubicO group peptidase (beta-lactamase class C family)
VALVFGIGWSFLNSASVAEVFGEPLSVFPSIPTLSICGRGRVTDLFDKGGGVRRAVAGVVGLGLMMTSGVARAGDVAEIATGFLAGVACSAAFVSGLDADRVIEETLDAMPGAGLLRWGLSVQLDPAARRVTARLFGAAPSDAVFQDGRGCRLTHGGALRAESGASAALPPEPASERLTAPLLVEPANPALDRAIARAFEEPEEPPFRRTKAVVVLKDGRLVAERYAPGYGPETLIHGFSATKSVTSALIGVLVGQGALSLTEPAPVAAWREPGDPRGTITVDHLLRHVSGLALGSSLNASLGSLFEPVNRMKFVERDPAGFAIAAGLDGPPGSVWNYHDGNTMILSRLIRDAARKQGEDAGGFARRVLFDPLGMGPVTLESDSTGTPDGSTQMFATARGWARFGQLYVNDGMAGGRRILPAGWARRSAAPTVGAWVGMGAGFWTNQGDSPGARRRIALGMPADAFLARGMFGQYVVIVPSERLVVARFGVTGGEGDIEGVCRLVAEAVAATRGVRS